jgi:hypothetical protein
MKRTLFVLSLLAFFFVGMTTLSAQNSIANASYNGMPVLTAYKKNFAGALEQGDVQMAQAHRTKLVSFMERDLQAAEASMAVPTNSKPAQADKDAATDLARQKTIFAEIKALNLDNADALQAAKAKLPLVDEYEKIFNKKTAASN